MNDAEMLERMNEINKELKAIHESEIYHIAFSSEYMFLIYEGFGDIQLQLNRSKPDHMSEALKYMENHLLEARYAWIVCPDELEVIEKEAV